MDWYDTAWLYRFKITSNDAVIDEALDNAYYSFANAPAGFWDHVRSDGGDVRITKSDGTTLVAREVAEWNYAGETGSLFFDCDGMSASSAVDWYVYYGNSAATEPAANSTYGSENVWNSNYMAVYHMNDLTTSTIKDSTANARNGTKSGANTPVQATGKVGYCQQFATDTISLGTGLSFSGACTGQFWVRTSSTTGMMFKKDSGAASGNEFSMQLDEAGHSYSFVRNYLSGAIGTTLINTDAWFYYTNSAPSGSGQAVDARINTTAQGSATTASDSATNSYFGRRESNSQLFTGYIDEARFSSVQLSNNYLTTDYNNQNAPGTFWTTGSEENAPAASGAMFFQFA